MAPYLLDSDILIDFLRGHEKARLLISEFESAEEIPLISTVSVAELVAGMRPGEKEATEKFLILLEKIPVSESMARLAGSFLRTYRKTHGLELGDALVAGTAVATATTLVTRNVKHYPMPQVNLFRPYE